MKRTPLKRGNKPLNRTLLKKMSNKEIMSLINDEVSTSKLYKNTLLYDGLLPYTLLKNYSPEYLHL